MKALFLLIIIAVGIFFGYPLINESTGSECDALERASIRIALSDDDGKSKPQNQVLGQLAQGFSKGQVASVAVKNEYPNVPVTAACAMLYWRAIVDPKGFRKAAETLRS